MVTEDSAEKGYWNRQNEILEDNSQSFQEPNQGIG